jgi:HemY protein
MLRILVFLIFATAAALGAVWLAERPGDVVVNWGGMTVETTVAVAAVGVVVLVLFGMLLWSLVRFLLGLPTAFSFASKARKRVRGYQAISRGMVAVGAGDPSAARRHAADAGKLISDEPLTLLLSAQAAQLSGDKPAAEAAFKAMLDEPETRVLGLRGLFVEARRRGDQAAARTFADEAVRLSPSLAWANDALLEFHTSAGDWSAARTAVERRASLRLADKTEAKRHRAVLMAAEALAVEASAPDQALTLALDAAKLAPGLTPAVTLAARLLSERKDTRKAMRLIEAAWSEQPHPDLAHIYVKARSGDSAADRLEKAEALHRLKSTAPESAFIVAECAIAARRFDRARAVLSPLVAAVPTVQTCLLMAQLEDAEHGAVGRAREWLTRSTRAPMDNRWVADGLVSAAWMPVSPASGRIDAFAWTLPPAALGGAPEAGFGGVDAIEPPPMRPQHANDAAPAAAPAAPVVVVEAVSAAPVMETAAAPVGAAATPGEPAPPSPDDPGPERAPAPQKRRFFGFGS